MKNNFQKGFTLIELMVSISIFTIVMTISMNSVLGIFDANRKSRSLKTVMSNLNISLETISKEMRYGSNYHCGSSGTFTEAENCPSGESLVSFLSSDNEQITYRLNGTVIEKDVDSAGYVPLSSPEVTIEGLTFYVLGAGTDNLLQPKANILIKGYAGSGDDQSNFVLQTLVSQRMIDGETVGEESCVASGSSLIFSGGEFPGQGAVKAFEGTSPSEFMSLYSGNNVYIGRQYTEPVSLSSIIATRTSSYNFHGPIKYSDNGSAWVETGSSFSLDGGTIESQIVSLSSSLGTHTYWAVFDNQDDQYHQIDELTFNTCD